MSDLDSDKKLISIASRILDVSELEAPLSKSDRLRLLEAVSELQLSKSPSVKEMKDAILRKLGYGQSPSINTYFTKEELSFVYRIVTGSKL